MQKVAREKVSYQERLNSLKDDLSSMCLDIDIGLILANSARQEDNESDSTATGTQQVICVGINSLNYQYSSSSISKGYVTF